MRALEKPLEDFETLPWKKILEKYDKYSLQSWLAASEGEDMFTIFKENI